MGSIVKSIGKAIGKIGKSIGKLVKKALPIILMAGVAYMGISAYGAMGSGLTGASAFSPSMFTKGIGDIGGKIMGGVQSVASGVGNFFSPPAMGGATGGVASGLSSAGTMAGANMSTIGGQHAFYNNAATGGFGNVDPMKFMTSSLSNNIAGATTGGSIADAMKYQSDMMWKGTMLKAGGAALTAMFDKSDEIAERNLDITEDEFKRRHTYGGFAMDSGKPSDYAKPGQPGHNPTGFWGQIGAGPPKYGSNNGGPRQFAQAGLKTPNVNSPGLINSRQGQRQTAGLLGQPNKSVA
tara:strand:- start:1861 stop:2745 length:885 start_codon:yes stop_codon:yes gene_type:complete